METWGEGEDEGEGEDRLGRFWHERQTQRAEHLLPHFAQLHLLSAQPFLQAQLSISQREWSPFPDFSHPLALASKSLSSNYLRLFARSSGFPS